MEKSVLAVRVPLMTKDLVQAICDQRAADGYTLFQSADTVIEQAVSAFAHQTLNKAAYEQICYKYYGNHQDSFSIVRRRSLETKSSE